MNPLRKYKIATTEQEFEEGRNLFQKYADMLELDLSFQDFDNELRTLSKQYNKPRGALLVVYEKDTAVGCVALRELDKHIAEIKRMFVLPPYRGQHIARTMLEKIIDIAAKYQYRKIRLDTLANMVSAIKLYRSFEFYEIPPYRFNPIQGAVFMEKRLS
jgi:ribosomal protein S18 acetylase RimI-like enzyme